MLEDEEVVEGQSYIYQDLESGRVKVTVIRIEEKNVTARLEGRGLEKPWPIETFKKYATVIL